MDEQEIKNIVSWLKKRITLDNKDSEIKIRFDEPANEDFKAANFSGEIIKLTLDASWWQEMVDDIIETPDFVEPDASPEQVLGYARDLVTEYIGKRLIT